MILPNLQQLYLYNADEYSVPICYGLEFICIHAQMPVYNFTCSITDGNERLLPKTCRNVNIKKVTQIKIHSNHITYVPHEISPLIYAVLKVQQSIHSRQ